MTNTKTITANLTGINQLAREMVLPLALSPVLFFAVGTLLNLW